MKKIFIILVTVLMLPWLTVAQDSRNRLVTTVIADALAQLPAQDQSIYNTMMADLAGTGQEGVVRMAAMLVPADKGKNATVEYALNGLAAYVTVPGRESMARNMSDGLVKAIENCDDNANKCFLISLLRTCGNAGNIPFLEKYLADDATKDQALNAIVFLPGGKDAVIGLVNSSDKPDAALVRAVADVNATGLEDKIIAWMNQTPAGQRRDYYRTLSRTGGEKSFNILEKAAKATGYKYDDDDATSAYIAMFTEGAGKGFDARLLKSAKSMLGGKAPVNMRGAALAAVFAFEKEKALPELIKAVKGNNRQYRVNALRLSEPWANAKAYAEINKTALKNKDTDALYDVINWYAANGTDSQIDFVIDAMKNNDPNIAASAIKAAAMIGGDKALEAISDQLYADNREIAAEALMHFDGDIAPCINKAITSSDSKAEALAIDLAGKRHVKDARSGIYQIVQNRNDANRPAALKALAGVATINELDFLIKTLSNTDGEDQKAVSDAVKAVLRGMPKEEQYAALKPYLNYNVKALFPALAQCGTPEAIEVLKNAYNNGDKSALDALLTVDSNDMIQVLYDIAVADKTVSTKALKRYASLARKSGYNGTRLFDIYTKGLAATSDAAVENIILNGLGETGVFPALGVAKEYVGKPATAAAAAAAIRTIASKNNYTGADVVSALEAAKAYYVAEGSADSGYAVDDINGMISRMTFNPVFKLTAEEEAEGFEILFDGTSLDRWKGSKTNYVPVDGAIFVTAQYGGHGNGNLYTDKEYSDFIYRFEFCFDSPGVNNGVGIRTSEGVDAAYYGMEIQVLEHDAPIYADLRPYQVHGSVYGIIPAKRIKSPEPGVWNTEEIRAVGDHITVTVNGEVILDGDIRKACKGHNVDPGGTRTNPYTVDHLNHPGLFNKKGLISFCGHGPGVRFRNIRIKDLSK